MGFEPMTSPLPTVCSTPELQRHYFGGDVTVGQAGLEPAKLSQRIYSPPPLPLGTLTQILYIVVNIVFEETKSHRSDLN